MTATVAGRVAAGAALLDAQLPGWAARIHLPDLRIASQCRCVLGQVYGDYVSGVLELFSDDFATREHGFMWGYDPVTGEDDLADVAALEAEWRRVIEARRAGP